MSKVLMVHPDRCTGCRNCELACTFFHENVFRPVVSRIHVFNWEQEGVSVPMTCQHCDDAPCVSVCPTGAMHRNPANNWVEWDNKACMRCKMCTIACPFGNAMFDAVTDSVVKCDMCKGAPECVNFCPNKAIEYVDDTSAVRGRNRAFAARFKDAFKDLEEVK